MINLDDYVKQLLNQYNISVENLTRDQLAEALQQAIKAGDFVRYVMEDGSAQNVSYIPFYDKQRLQHINDRYQEALIKIRDTSEDNLIAAIADDALNPNKEWILS